MNDYDGLKKFRVMVMRCGFVEFWAETAEEAIDNTDCMSWNDVDWIEFDPETDAIALEVTEESED